MCVEILLGSGAGVFCHEKAVADPELHTEGIRPGNPKGVSNPDGS